MYWDKKFIFEIYYLIAPKFPLNRISNYKYGGQIKNFFLAFRKFFWYYIFIKEMIMLLKLDYTLDSPEERKALVEKILEENPDYNLEALADYLILCMEKKEKKEKKFLTDNRMLTVNKRETSFEGLV
jgi:hypothetical protein